MIPSVVLVAAAAAVAGWLLHHNRAECRHLRGMLYTERYCRAIEEEQSNCEIARLEARVVQLVKERGVLVEEREKALARACDLTDDQRRICHIEAENERICLQARHSVLR